MKSVQNLRRQIAERGIIVSITKNVGLQIGRMRWQVLCLTLNDKRKFKKKNRLNIHGVTYRNTARFNLLGMINKSQRSGKANFIERKGVKITY